MKKPTEKEIQALEEWLNTVIDVCDEAMRKLDPNGEFKPHFEDDKAKVLSGNPKCAICGKPIDSSLSFPDPESGTVHLIIPISEGGRPCIENMQPAHLKCENDDNRKRKRPINKLIRKTKYRIIGCEKV